ncbi:MAG: type II toxin-antitoxin system HipA family toxin [Alphaproteobacteria bacterium]
MAFQQVNVINVSYRQTKAIVPVGRLALKDRKIFFEYAHSFLNSGLELSPFKLPLKPGITVCEDRVFDGLFGVFNDSLPDGWGRLLLDRKVMKAGVNPGVLTPLDRLRYVGTRGMGALVYEPEIMNSKETKPEQDLDVIAEECFALQENDDDSFVDELLALNGSSAGARPKILIKLGNDNWIIKFRSSFDPKDSGPIEYAYHLMAKAAGLDVPEARLFNSKTGDGYFGVKRFDAQNTCVHMHTVSGLLHADHRIPSLDYETVMQSTLWLTKDSRECERQFRNAVFNVLAHNRDDHSKNFSYLMSADGVWRVSPAYDLTFSSGPAGEHCTTIMGEGKNPGVSHLLKLAQVASINQNKALEIIDHVKEAVARWAQFAKVARVKSLITIS